jgi:oxygen-independent coproporphyrinogen III oxidase
MSALFAKYDVPAPRYTSYPTVPYWETPPTSEDWLKHIQLSLSEKDAAWSLYIHIPYCETLCTFCGCNTIITKDHGREQPYVDVVLKEWNFYLSRVLEFKSRPLQHLHLGGGTPTFLSGENLIRLLEPILKSVTLAPHFEGSIEVDPRRTKSEHLEALRQMGFNRISLGVQDFTP